MKLFFLLFVSICLTIYSCEREESVNIKDEWRCGAPIVREFLKHDALKSIKKMSSKNILKAGLEKISIQNIERYENNLLPFSKEEKIIVKLITEKFLPPIIHRTSISAIELILKSKQGLVSPTKLGIKPRITQPVEQSLFSAEDCIFASVAYPNGDNNFGDVIIKIKNKSKFSWGSLYAGHTWIKGILNLNVEEPITSELKLDFARQVFVNNHYAKILSYQIIKNIRQGSSIQSWGKSYNKKQILKKLVSETESSSFWEKIYKYRLAFLEGHYIDNISLEELEYISIRLKDEKKIKSLIKKLNLDMKLIQTY
jgi:hypothetical protein